MALEVVLARERPSTAAMRADMGLQPIWVMGVHMCFEVVGTCESTIAIGALMLAAPVTRLSLIRVLNRKDRGNGRYAGQLRRNVVWRHSRLCARGRIPDLVALASHTSTTGVVIGMGLGHSPGGG